MSDLEYMELAFAEAKKAYKKREVPVGAILVLDDKVIAKAYNKREKSNNPLGHAEINVIVKASKKLKNKILEGATLYVTLEPCLMCAGLILQTRIQKIVYGAKEPKFGVLNSLGNVYLDYNFNHKVDIVGPIMEEKVSELMKKFFKELRDQKKQTLEN